MINALKYTYLSLLEVKLISANFYGDYYLESFHLQGQYAKIIRFNAGTEEWPTYITINGCSFKKEFASPTHAFYQTFEVIIFT